MSVEGFTAYPLASDRGSAGYCLTSHRKCGWMSFCKLREINFMTEHKQSINLFWVINFCSNVVYEIKLGVTRKTTGESETMEEKD